MPCRELLRKIFGLLVSGVLLGSPSAAGDSSPAETEAPAETRPAGVSESEEPRSDQAPGEATENDPCRPDGEREAWLDRMQRGIFRSVCSSARWFDGFFGDARYEEEAEATWGRLSVDTLYDEHDGFEADVDLRAEVEFPNLDQRVDAFLGREKTDDFVAGREDDLEALPELFRDGDEREWLVGLGYRPVHGSHSRDFDIRLGVEIRFPLEPFVQGRYRHYWLLSENRLLRFRNIVFWRNQRGFGNSATVDVEQALGESFLLRWSGSATYSESTRGIDWGSRLSLYQNLGGQRALAYSIFATGETDAVPVERYGFRAVYRQQMLREWFFGQLIAGFSFPREAGADRETAWLMGFGFEIRYGRGGRWSD